MEDCWAGGRLGEGTGTEGGEIEFITGRRGEDGEIGGEESEGTKGGEILGRRREEIGRRKVGDELERDDVVGRSNVKDSSLRMTWRLVNFFLVRGL